MKPTTTGRYARYIKDTHSVVIRLQIGRDVTVPVADLTPAKFGPVPNTSKVSVSRDGQTLYLGKYQCSIPDLVKAYGSVAPTARRYEFRIRIDMELEFETIAESIEEAVAVCKEQSIHIVEESVSDTLKIPKQEVSARWGKLVESHVDGVAPGPKAKSDIGKAWRSLDVEAFRDLQKWRNE